MVSLNKSFFYGIGFASITWAVSLYLYWQLTQTLSIRPSPTSSSIQAVSQSSRIDAARENDEMHEAPYIKGGTYVNSPQLVKKLQPLRKSKLQSKNAQVLDELGMVKTVEDQRVRDEGFKLHAFNVLISNKLSLHRELPDTRNKLCKDVIYPAHLPAASVIVCFYNEHFMTLLRTIHSILGRTPGQLLTEIVLVDDFSDISDLNINLTNYMNNNSGLKEKVMLFKTQRREGLIRARMFGAQRATGKVLIFLDSHIEVNVDWIQPLLARVYNNRSNVAIPVIDIINADTFAYTPSPLVRGGFNWGLHFKWENLPTGTIAKPIDLVNPIKSPTMAGGLFAIDRNYFMEIGQYDAGMDIWGGENLEISFRIWMCGGRLDIVPCSRVGHVFRRRRPYGDPDGKDTMLRNSLRVAHVWMDAYKDYFIKERPDASNVNFGDVSERVQLRKRLKCYDFNWYIKNVYPELTLPTDSEVRLKNKWSALEQDKFQPWHTRKRNYVDHYKLRLSNTSYCAQSTKDSKSKGSTLYLKLCTPSKNQIWFETDKGELVLQQLLCLQSGPTYPYLFKCHEMGGNQEWKHKGESKTPIYNMAAGMCLGVDQIHLGAKVRMKLCTDPSLNMWDLVS
ncbi:hypothetical protein PPYR_09525 [Photinus pyralis]|uniref:Polypeptide N-acetylgalactosaminyltransferase n=1 Tax=Photinus pyralis TaxID=7054 RepID=A0A5N4AMF3_PHOPY|nr:polypeptide N-acetylgalactosaminyltransferase 35A [Photinus pyralis]KAB0798532.1 hypothetical protein PPYR_09525 [Photinus pyralis]